MPAFFFFFFLITSQSAKGNGGIHGRKKTYVAIVWNDRRTSYGIYILLYLPLVGQFSE